MIHNNQLAELLTTSSYTDNFEYMFSENTENLRAFSDVYEYVIDCYQYEMERLVNNKRYRYSCNLPSLLEVEVHNAELIAKCPPELYRLVHIELEKLSAQPAEQLVIQRTQVSDECINDELEQLLYDLTNDIDVPITPV